jgi:hypothetical protein
LGEPLFERLKDHARKIAARVAPDLNALSLAAEVDWAGGESANAVRSWKILESAQPLVAGFRRDSTSNPRRQSSNRTNFAKLHRDGAARIIAKFYVAVGGVVGQFEIRAD